MRGTRRGGHPRGTADRYQSRPDRSVADPAGLGRRGLLRAVRISAVAIARSDRPRCAAGAADRPLPALTAGPDHAGVPADRAGGADTAARCAQRGTLGVAGQPDPHPGVRAQDVVRRAEPDVEPVGRDELLSGTAAVGVGGGPVAGAGPGAGDRAGCAGQFRLGLSADPDQQWRQSAELGPGLCGLVRRRNVVGRMDLSADELVARVGAPSSADVHPGAGGLSGGGVPTGGAADAQTCHRRTVHHPDGARRRHRGRSVGAVGARPARGAAQDSGQHTHGGPGSLVLWAVPVASGHPGHGAGAAEPAGIDRRLSGRLRGDGGVRLGHCRGQLCPDRGAVPVGVAPVGDSPAARAGQLSPAGAGSRAGWPGPAPRRWPRGRAAACRRSWSAWRPCRRSWPRSSVRAAPAGPTACRAARFPRR